MPTPEGESSAPFIKVQQLIRIAATTFRAKGYASSSTREIAEQLGWQKSSLYHYVKSKEELLYFVCADCLRHIHQEVSAAVAQAPTPLERVPALVFTHIQVSLAQQDQFATTLLEMRHLSGRMSDTVHSLHEEYQELVEQVMAEAQAAGVLRADVSPKYLMLMLLGMLNWSAFWYHPGHTLTPEALGAVMLQQFLEGAQAHP
jgi:TetR/AcrR family transcriptional regulator, cholesterol catabolism regulator